MNPAAPPAPPATPPSPGARPPAAGAGVHMPDVDALIAAVRRRLRRERLRDALRRACWATALLLPMAAALHLALHALPAAGVAAAFAIGWTLWIGAAISRGDSDADCARWADRRLDGASAYETLLEQRVAASAAPANARLQAWAAARVPHSLQQLAGLRVQPALARPLATLGVAALLGAVLLALPGRTPSQAADAAPSRPARTPQAPEATAPQAASPLLAARSDRSLDEIARATRGLARSEPRGRHDDEERRSGTSAAPRHDPSRADSAAQRASTGPGDPVPSAADAARAAPAPADAAPAMPSTRPGLAGATGTDAGRSADERAVLGASRALPGPLDVQRSPLGPRAVDAGALQASDEAGEHVDALAAAPSRPASALNAPPAAAPPAIAETRMTPAETHYVRAWARALGPAR